MDNSHIEAMRAFNRYYTSMIGVLNKKFLNGKYALPELRVLQAIHFQDGITASEIIALLNIDKSYLSRMLLQFEKKKLVVKKISLEDARSFHLHLSALGQKEFAVHDAAVHQQVKQLLGQLSAKDCNTLISCMTRIKAILSKPGLTK